MRPQRHGIGDGCLPNPHGCYGGGSRAAYDHYDQCCAPQPSCDPCAQPEPHHHEPHYPPQVPVPPGTRPGRPPGRQPTGGGDPGGPHDWYRAAPTGPPPRPTGPHGGPHDQYRAAPMPQPPSSGIGACSRDSGGSGKRPAGMGFAAHRKYMKGLNRGATSLTARRVQRSAGVTGRVR